jgi:hypothetical protein
MHQLRYYQLLKTDSAPRSSLAKGLVHWSLNSRISLLEFGLDVHETVTLVFQNFSNTRPTYGGVS